MSYIRSKMIYGCGPYYYEVRSVREGKTVRQEHIRYIGTTPQRVTRRYVVPKGESEILAKNLRSQTYYHVIRKDRTGEILRHGLMGRREIDEKTRVYVWDNVQSAQKYREMLKEDYPDVTYDILKVRIPKNDPIESEITYGLPGAKSVTTDRIAPKNVQILSHGS